MRLIRLPQTEVHRIRLNNRKEQMGFCRKLLDEIVLQIIIETTKLEAHSVSHWNLQQRRLYSIR